VLAKAVEFQHSDGMSTSEGDERDSILRAAQFATTHWSVGVPQANATIVDDDSLVLTISDVSVREGESGTSNAQFTVTLSKPYHLPVSVEFSTGNGSALAGSDYTATNGTLTFAPGETTQTVSVALNGDLTDEANENFFLNLTNAVNVTLTDIQAKATIVDDDPLVLSIS
jgi:hypothetical protein